MGGPGRRAIRVLPPTDEVDALLARIRPPRERLELASDLPTKVREHLRKTRRLTTVEPHTRLAGSYGRRVSTHQIKDVDVMVFVSESYRALGPARLLDDLEVALDGFAARRKAGRIEKHRQRRSVRVTFTDDDFYIDLVPALAPDGAEGTLEIPDRADQRWVKTASIQYGPLFSDLNQRSGGNLVPLVLLLRHWQLERCKDIRVKGYWLEALPVDLIQRDKIVLDSRPLLDMAADTFDAIFAYCEAAKRRDEVPVIPDPVLRGNVAALWMKSEFGPFFERLEHAHRVVARASAATTESEAIGAWQELFGASYLAPTPVLIQIAQAATAMAVGGALALLLSVAIGKRR